MELIRRFTEDEYSVALKSWEWLPVKGKVPFLANAFGDVFLESDEGIYFLDTVEGKLDKICDTQAELQEILKTRDGQEKYLWSIVVVTNHQIGLIPKANEVYDFEIMPVLGGELEPENITVCDFQVAANLAGQIHSQVKDLPPGTKITDIKTEGI